MTETAPPTIVGRYLLHAPIARGGMATIHLARLLGAEGFSRTVAAKRLHPQFTEDGEFLKMFLDEARIASKVHHPNVVPMLDVVQTGAEVILVQEYVHGVPLDKLVRAARQQKRQLPVEVVVAIVAGALAGLHAAHEATDELGHPLGIVHRDVSPQNVLVGVDGIARLLDFGVAKATLNTHVTRTGVFKGKLGYASPELLRGVVTRATDIYASGVVLWEALAGRRLYVGMNEAELISAVVCRGVPKLTSSVDRASASPERWRQLEKLERVVSNATSPAKEDRYATAAAMQEALLEAAPAATPAAVSWWVKRLGREYLEGREKLMVAEESSFRRRMAVPLGSGEASSTSGAGSQRTATLRASVLSSPPEASRARWPLAVALVSLSVLLAGILGSLWWSPVVPAGVAAPVPPLSPVAMPPAPAAAPPEPTFAAPTRTPPTADPTASADREARPVPRPPAAPRGAPGAPRLTPRAAAPANDCDPPFYFDGRKKIFKPGCL
jgi:eukaryotic-like serine/threonine-protein kinase